jgi:hypothetical protein
VRATVPRIFVLRILRAACWTATLCACAVTSAAIEPSRQPTSANRTADLPDAPDANLSSTSGSPYAPSAETETSYSEFRMFEPTPLSPRAGETTAPKLTRQELDAACQSGTLHGKPCRVHWLPILWEAFEATAYEQAGNIGFDEETRHDLVTNPYWATYIKCVHQFRYRQWRDDDDFMVDYVGHGMQGAIVASSFEQHDPKGRGLIYINNGNYWRSRLKAMAWVTVFEVQWKIGPASESSIGNSGLNTYFTPRVKGRSTNETGFQDFVDTPVIGLWWNVGEDALDRFVMPRIWKRTHNRLILTAVSPLTPCKAAANILRFKPLYYRDFPLTPLR